MEAKVKRTTDNVENLIKELENNMSVINLTRKKSNHQNMMKERELFM